MRIKPIAQVVFRLALVLACPAASAAADFRLIEAAKARHIETVRALIQQGADVNVTYGDRATALHWAAYWDDPEILDLLISAGARVNPADDHGITPLWLACSNGARPATVERLLGAGADPKVTHSSGETALMSASRTGHAAAVRLLLAAGAEVNRTERARAQTALMWAAAQGHVEIAQALIEGGANLQMRSRARRQVVNTTGNADYTGVMEVEQGGFTALLFAVRGGHLEVVKRLLSAGGDANDTAADGTSALVVAAHSGHPATATFLLGAGADPNAHGSGYTAVHIAVRRGEVELVKALLARGADPNARLVKPTPARRLSDDVALSRPLVGATPLWLAAQFGHPDVLRVLTAAGADFTMTANDGTTPLIAAIGRNAETAVAAVTHLAALGADVNAADENGSTALHRAASSGFDALVALLAEKGARLDVRNKQGQTPLMLTRARRTPQGVVEQNTTAALLRKLGARN